MKYDGLTKNKSLKDNLAHFHIYGGSYRMFLLKRVGNIFTSRKSLNVNQKNS